MLFVQFTDNQPEFIIYDDACHLKRFADNTIKKAKKPSNRLLNFASKKFVIDKLHFHGHTEAWCRTHCNPNNHQILNDVNTMVCEQINFLLGRFKHQMKHMNDGRFFVTAYTITNTLNNLKLNSRFNPMKYLNLKKNKISTEDEVALV